MDKEKKVNKKEVGKCEISDVEGYVQEHHLFRVNIRNNIKYKLINIKWITEEGNVVKSQIQMNTTVNVCDEKHKLIHPENLNFHLNEMIVKKIKKSANVNFNNNTTRVNNASIQVINSNKLKVNDYILWNKYKCKVIEIHGNKKKFCTVLQDENDENSKINLAKFSIFYKIMKCDLRDK